ncbi:MAG TPA: triose-phosphate isomerase [Woeseiaceae bacterium]|nr:triose-phosphate isomerase [Woeseiaceae bacterium]
MRRFLVAGNWKMNGDSRRNRELVAGIVAGLQDSATVEVLVCPPLPYLAAVKSQLSGHSVLLGAQNVSEHAQGAYTGETAAGMLVDVGCSHVIVGHSERRALYGESSNVVASKFRAAADAGLIPVLCVGETLAEREAGQTEVVVGQQLAAVVETCGIAVFGRAVIAYEPVWAIGTGKVASPDEAQAVHRFIRDEIAARDETIAAGVQILYGGSMKGENADGLLSMPDIDGGLIGGASLKAADFLAITKAAQGI